MAYSRRGSGREWLKFLGVGLTILAGAVALWSLAGISPEGEEEPHVESSGRSRRNSGSERAGAAGSRTLSHLDDMIARIQAQLFDVGDSRFDDRLIWNFVDGLSVEEVEMLSHRFLLKANPGSRPWKVALVARWSELDEASAKAYLEAQVARLKESGDQRFKFVTSLRPILLLGHARANLESAWSSLPAEEKESKNQLLKYLAARTPDEGFALLESVENSASRQAEWRVFLANLSRDVDWEGFAVRLEKRSWFANIEPIRVPTESETLRLYDISEPWFRKSEPLDFLFFRKWASNDANGAVDWYRRNARGEKKLGEVISHWAGKEPKSVTRWVQSEVKGARKEFVFETIRENFRTPAKPELWLGLSQYLPDQGDRFEILKQAVIRSVDPREIRETLSRSRLSQGQEEEILELLESTK